MNFPPNAPPPGGYGPAPPPGGFGYGGYGGYGAGASPIGPMMTPWAHAPFGVDPVSGIPFSDKSRMVGGLLSIFLGVFGVGRFYTGHVGIAFAQIAITLVTCGIFGWVWPTIDAIMIFTGKLTDAQGRPLRE